MTIRSSIRTMGVNWYDFEARYLDSSVPGFTTVDPLAEKYFSWSPYAYVANNPLRYVDPTGESYTDYRNDKGELLYRTNDGLKDVIIVADGKIPELKEVLQKANNDKTINNAETNKQEMHTLGKTPQEYKNEVTKNTGDYWEMGYNETYSEAYTEGKSHFSIGQIFSAIIAAIATENKDVSGQQRHAGRTKGIKDGDSDRKNEKMNRLNPYSSFKNNSPW